MNIEKSMGYYERDKKVVGRCQHLSYYPLVIDKHQGAILTDIDGNEYIDFLSSASSLNLGGCHPVITKAIKEQADKFTQFTFAYTYNEKTIEYAEKLCSVFPGGAPAKIVFGNSGSDSNDAAVKFARAYTGRSRIIVFRNGYHGCTIMSAAMTTCTTRMHKSIGPTPADLYVFPFYGVDVDDETAEREGTKAIEEAFESYIPADEVAAVIIEPIQGDGGILPAHPIFMKKLYELCKANGILFIAEEVQQGFYRTGKFFSIENYGIIPDGIIMGKSVGASLTLGAFMARPEIIDCLPAPAHLFTLGGNAIACAAGCAAFDYYQTEEFQNMLKEHTECLVEEANKLMAKYPEQVMFVRNIGMSMGIGFGKKEDGKFVPDNDGTYKVLYRCYEKGLIVISLAGNVFRIQPPLVITNDQIKKAFAIMAEAIDEYNAGQISDEVYAFRAGW